MNSADIYNTLLEMYGKPRWWSDDPYVIIFQAVLVRNTSWNSVKNVTNLIGERLNPEYISSLPEEQLRKLITPAGAYKAKSATIKEITEWYKMHTGNGGMLNRDYTTEELRRELLGIKGIGRETADVIILYAFHKNAFVVDAYTRRLLERLGVRAESDDEIRDYFMKDLTKEYKVYGWMHWLILEHCVIKCKKKPACGGCAFVVDCQVKLTHFYT